MTLTIVNKRHVEWLEREIAVVREKHVEEIARLQAANEELKKAHAAELSRVIEENQQLRDDVKRLQLLAIPALKNVEIHPDTAPPPAPVEDIFRGGAWNRVLAREIAAQEKAAASRYVRPVIPTEEGAANGSNGEGRVEAPLGEQSKTA